MQTELAVIVPCLNEDENLERLVNQILEAASESNVATQVVLIDDGSIDFTWSEIERLETLHPEVLGVRHDANLGIAAAWRSGLAAHSARYSCFIDADLQNAPKDIYTLYDKLLESEADIAQGVRSMVGRRRDWRWVLSRSLNLLLNLTFRMRASDSKSGFVVAPSVVLRDIVNPRKKYRHFQTFISVAAQNKGYSIVEIDTAFSERRSGRSFISGRTMRVVLAVLLDFVPALLEFTGRHHPYLLGIGPLQLTAKRRSHPYTGWRRVLFELYFATMPLHKWFIRRSARQLYLELKASEWLSREELADLQLAKLQRLALHAHNHVPLYRQRMRSVGIDPLNIHSVDDLRSLPLLGKEDVRENLYFDLFAVDHDEKDLLKITTSGSTGEPFTTYADRYQLEMRMATTLRALEWTGWRFGDRQARLWHQTLGMSKSQVLRERLDALFMRRLFVPAFEISPKNIEAFVQRIRNHDPVLVDGYAESLNFLATYVKSGHSAGFSPRAMMSSAQALPQSTRTAIEEGFGTRVFDKYGSREFSGIAYQCASSNDYHVMDESYIVEILVDGRPAQPGETGEVVITDLNNFAVPLIRYRIGDLAQEVDNTGPCACGRSLRRIGSIQGRTQAIVHCMDGTWIPGTFFAHFFKDHEEVVRQFQVVQERKGEFILRVVLAENARTHELGPVLEQLGTYVGDTHVTVEFVDEIPLIRTGKRSPVVSTVVQDFQDGLGGPREGSLVDDTGQARQAHG